jgi:hypothetical protein
MEENNMDGYNEIDERDSDIETEFGMEESIDTQQDAYGDSTPQFSIKDDLFGLFWKIVKIKDSSKVGYLDKHELGMLPISVRDCQSIANLAETLGKKGFATYFKNMGEIILATSSSKDGFLPNLFVTQRKFSTKSKGVDNSANFHKNDGDNKKKGLFGKR